MSLVLIETLFDEYFFLFFKEFRFLSSFISFIVDPVPVADPMFSNPPNVIKFLLYYPVVDFGLPIYEANGNYFVMHGLGISGD
jgi:hypothetical protein